MKRLAALTLGTLTLSAAISTPSRFVVKHREHNGIGYDTGYTTAELFAATKWKNGLMPYADFRGHALNDGRFAANAGLGLRYNWSDYTLGGNFYYDYREAANLQPHQLAGGLEFLSNNYDIRINGYGPIADTGIEKQSRFEKFQGNSAIFKRRFKAALPMIEGEVGMPFGGRCGIANFYGAIGPYYLFSKKVNGCRLGDAIGGEARILLDIIQRFNCQFNFSYDKIFKWVLQGTAGISIPLGKRETILRSKNFLCEARNQLPYRKEIIPIECKNKRATSSSRFIFVDNTSSSNGTFESPYPTTALAMANSRRGDIIYIFPGDGTTTGYNTALTMLPNQTIQGSGAKLDLGSGLVVPAQTSQFPKLTSGAATITLSRNSTVRGLNISGNFPIVSSDPTPPVGGLNRVEYNFVHNASADGIFVGNEINPVNYIIRKNVVRQCTSSGIIFITEGIAPNTVNAVLSENSVSNVGASGLAVTAQGTANLGIALIGNEISSGDMGIVVQTENNALVNSILKGNTARNITSQGMSTLSKDTSQSTLQLSYNAFGPSQTGTSGALRITSEDSSQQSAFLSSNAFFDAGANNQSIILLNPADSSSQMIQMEKNLIFGRGIGILMVNISATNFNLTVDNNIFYNTTGEAIQDNSSIAILNSYSYDIRNNRFLNIGARPIFLSSQVTGVTMQTTLFNNVLFGANANTIAIEGNTGDVCANIIGNQAPGQGLLLEQTNPSVFNVETTTPGSPQGLLDLNTFNAINTSGTINFVPFGTCP